MIYGIAAVAGLIIGFILHVVFVKVAGSKSMNAANKFKNDAEREAERLLREARVTAKSDVLKIKEEFENEMKERRREIQSSERRLAQKEENLDRKADSFEAKVKNVERKERDIDALKERLSAREDDMKKAIARQIDELERITELDRESAKTLLLEKLKGEVENECGILIRNIVDEAKQKAERESQRLLVHAIQRYAGECTYERTTATIPLPSDEMKGRIIGREGRNIRALEAATGVNILIDDTPEAVVISCFDPIRKEIARRLLEKLISDGRIHPTRIEELIKKIRKEIDEEVFDAGEKRFSTAAFRECRNRSSPCSADSSSVSASRRTCSNTPSKPPRSWAPSPRNSGLTNRKRAGSVFSTISEKPSTMKSKAPMPQSARTFSASTMKPKTSSMRLQRTMKKWKEPRFMRSLPMPAMLSAPRAPAPEAKRQSCISNVLNSLKISPMSSPAWNPALHFRQAEKSA